MFVSFNNYILTVNSFVLWFANKLLRPCGVNINHGTWQHFAETYICSLVPTTYFFNTACTNFRLQRSVKYVSNKPYSLIITRVVSWENICIWNSYMSPCHKYEWQNNWYFPIISDKIKRLKVLKSVCPYDRYFWIAVKNMF